MGTKAALWELIRRGMLWYAAAGAVLGWTYGCAFYSVAFFGSFLAEEEPPWVAALIATPFILGFAACGWILARNNGSRASSYVVAGVYTAISLPGLPFSVVTLPVGGTLGVAYGRVFGLASGLATAGLTCTFFPLQNAGCYRRIVVRARRVLLVALAALLLVGVALWHESLREFDALLTFGIVFVLLPDVILWLPAGWLGGKLADSHARRAGLLADAADGRHKGGQTDRYSTNGEDPEDQNSVDSKILTEESGR